MRSIKLSTISKLCFFLILDQVESTRIKEDNMNSQEKKHITSSLAKWQNDIGLLCGSKNFSDVTFLIDDVKIFAHKVSRYLPGT